MGMLEATRERYPAHYHVALFPRQYASYVDGLLARQASAAENGSPADSVEYTVRNGDSLWTIARSLGTTVEQIQRLNNLRGSRIYAGQTLAVPGSG